MDTKRYARFSRPGHAVTGDRASTRAENREQVGYEYSHAIIDDHTRLAYSELHPDQRADTVVSLPGAHSPGTRATASPRSAS